MRTVNPHSPHSCQNAYTQQFINHLDVLKKGREERAVAEKAVQSHYLVTQAIGKCADVS